MAKHLTNLIKLRIKQLRYLKSDNIKHLVSKLTLLSMITLLSFFVCACQEKEKQFQATGLVEAKPFYVRSPEGGELKNLYVVVGESVSKNRRIAKIKGQTTIKSPERARVLEVFYLENEYVMPGTSLMSLLFPDEMHIIFYVPEKNLNHIQYKKVVTIRYRNHDYPAKITFIANRAEYTPDSLYIDNNRDKSVFKVKTSIPKQLKEVIKLGQSVEVIYE